MDVFLKILLSLGGLLLIWIGVGFLFDPQSAAAGFGISAEGAHGLTSIRADFTAFFTVGGGCYLVGAWKRNKDTLIIGAALMLVTLAVRLIALASYGSFEGYIAPMIVEAVLGILAIFAARRWSSR